MWWQAAFVLQLLIGLTGVAGHAVLAIFVLALALAQLSSTGLGASGNFLRKALRRFLSAQLASIRISIAASSVATARTCWTNALCRDGLRVSGASSRMSGGISWQTEGPRFWLMARLRFGLSTVWCRGAGLHDELKGRFNRMRLPRSGKQLVAWTQTLAVGNSNVALCAVGNPAASGGGRRVGRNEIVR